MISNRVINYFNFQEDSMLPLAHVNQNLQIQKEPPNQKTLFRQQTNTKKTQENTRLSFTAKTAVAVLSSLSASYLVYQNLPSKVPVAPPPSTINPMVWVIGTLTASALFFRSKMNKGLINSENKTNNDTSLREIDLPERTDPSIDEQQKTPKEIYKDIKERFNETKTLTVDDFNELNKIIKYLETNNQSEIDSKLAFSLTYFIRRLIRLSKPESHEMVAKLTHTAFDSFWQINRSNSFEIAEVYAKVFDSPEKNILVIACKEINDKILCSNDNKLQLRLATYYAKGVEDPTLFEHIINTAWNHFQNDPELATEFLITCANSEAELCQKYISNFAHLNWGQENNTKIALACTADMTQQGNKDAIKFNGPPPEHIKQISL
jgi:hypothetical protein